MAGHIINHYIGYVRSSRATRTGRERHQLIICTYVRMMALGCRVLPHHDGMHGLLDLFLASRAQGVFRQAQRLLHPQTDLVFMQETAICGWSRGDWVVRWVGSRPWHIIHTICTNLSSDLTVPLKTPIRRFSRYHTRTPIRLLAQQQQQQQ